MEQKISDTDAVHTPELKRKSRACHVTMLKCYFSRESAPQLPPAATVVSVCAAALQNYPSDDGLTGKCFSASHSLEKFRSAEITGVCPILLVHIYFI